MWSLIASAISPFLALKFENYSNLGLGELTGSLSIHPRLKRSIKSAHELLAGSSYSLVEIYAHEQL